MAAGQTVTQKSVGGITGNRANDRAFSRVGDARRIKGSGNGFADPGFDPAEAEVMKLRAEVMIRIGQWVKSMVWTQAEAARRLGVTQPRISRLVEGKWEDFSLDMLSTLAARAGLKPSLRVAA
jgi:predicted XRE-type DNA-binding protein